ncbi:hypothetical protein GBAR_LOCUS1907, partial [Geodia barretti]
DEDTQSFAIVAEIGADIPDEIACFHTFIGETECHGRQGAAEIKIIDNDPMIIGFTDRFRTVQESAIPGSDLTQLLYEVATLRASEREHRMIIRYQESISTAVVEPLGAITRTDFDAVFGSRNSPDDPIEIQVDLRAQMDSIWPLVLSIRNDFSQEPEECFTLRILPVDVPGRR